MRAEWGRMAAGEASKLWTGGFVMLAGPPTRSPQWALSRRKKKRERQKHRDERGCMFQRARKSVNIGIFKDWWKTQKIIKCSISLRFQIPNKCACQWFG